jgi:outer membrane protein assembly factor BamB
VAGDLVFTSTFTGEVLAFDRASGKQVWSMQAPGGINSPMSAAGDTLLVPVGLGPQPMVLALVLGATGTIPTSTPDSRPHELSVAQSLREHRAADQHSQPG